MKSKRQVQNNINNEVNNNTSIKYIWRDLKKIIDSNTTYIGKNDSKVIQHTLDVAKNTDLTHIDDVCNLRNALIDLINTNISDSLVGKILDEIDFLSAIIKDFNKGYGLAYRGEDFMIETEHNNKKVNYSESFKMSMNTDIYVYFFKSDGEMLIPDISIKRMIDGRPVVFGDPDEDVAYMGHNVIVKYHRQGSKKIRIAHRNRVIKHTKTTIPAYLYILSIDRLTPDTYFEVIAIYPHEIVKGVKTSPVVKIRKINIYSNKNIQYENLEYPMNFMTTPITGNPLSELYAYRDKIDQYMLQVKNTDLSTIAPEDYHTINEQIRELHKAKNSITYVIDKWQEYFSRYPLQQLRALTSTPFYREPKNEPINTQTVAQ